MRFAATMALLLPCSLLLTTCSEVCGCEPVPATTTISGTVTDATGAPVANAVISAFTDNAAGCHPGSFDGETTSNGDGTFLLTLYQGLPQDSVCAFTFAQPNDGIGGLDGSDTVLVIVDLRYSYPQDSASVNFTLPPE
jgi:hypothetical protein